MDQLLEPLLCKVCKKKYSSPIVLPCGHTFCQTCLVSLTSNSMITCSICLKTSSVLSEAFPTNYALVFLIASFNELLFRLSNAEKTIELNEAESKKTELSLIKTQNILDELETRIETKEQNLETLKIQLEWKNAELKLKESHAQHCMSQQSKEISLKEQELKEKTHELNRLEEILKEQEEKLLLLDQEIHAKINKSIEICNKKEQEYLVKFRVLQLKEILLNRKDKQQFKERKKYKDLEKDMHLMLSSQYFLQGASEKLKAENTTLKSQLSKYKVPKNHIKNKPNPKPLDLKLRRRSLNSTL